MQICVFSLLIETLPLIIFFFQIPRESFDRVGQESRYLSFQKHSLYSRHSRITGLGEAVIHRKALRITNLRKTTDMAEVG
jgi:hypothetical protein